MHACGTESTEPQGIQRTLVFLPTLSCKAQPPGCPPWGQCAWWPAPGVPALCLAPLLYPLLEQAGLSAPSHALRSPGSPVSHSQHWDPSLLGQVTGWLPAVGTCLPSKVIGEPLPSGLDGSTPRGLRVKAQLPGRSTEKGTQLKPAGTWGEGCGSRMQSLAGS